MFQKEVIIRPVCSLLPKEVALCMASYCLLDNHGLTGKKRALPVQGERSNDTNNILLSQLTFFRTSGQANAKCLILYKPLSFIVTIFSLGKWISELGKGRFL